jgi:DNA-binding transcriptional LysR family regulator
MHATVLRYFLEVARNGSVRKAAEKLFVAPSAINRQILMLEEELAVELFERKPKGLQLNAAGERLLRHVQGTLLDFEMVRTDIDALKGEKTGEVRVATMDSLLVEVLPSALEEFSRSFPAVTYTILGAPPSDIASMLQSARVDIGCTFIDRIPPSLKVAASARMPMGMVMPPGHPLASRVAVSLEQCAQYPYIRSSVGPAVSASMSPEFAQFWEETVPVATCSSTTTIKRLILAGKGISCFSKIAFIEELTRGELIWKPFDFPSMNLIQVGIFIPAQRNLNNVAQHFLARLVKKLRELEVGSAHL